MTIKEKYKSALSRYIPDAFVDNVVDLLIEHPVVFKISKPRKTKLGDFRSQRNGKKHQITVNGDLNEYAFLITTLHEFAHLIVHKEHGHNVKPHGLEWKTVFGNLLIPIIESNDLPEDIANALNRSINNVKASSCSDQQLYRVLLRYNEQNDNMTVLESLEKNSTFELNGKTYVKGVLRRTRFLCTETSSKKQYLVNALTHVREIE